MKTLKSIFLFIVAGLMVLSCQKDSLEPVDEFTVSNGEFTVPIIPDEIAAMMSDEDIARFNAGPGEEYLQSFNTENARRRHGRWHPVLMNLGYHLQFGPFVGESCDAPIPCFGPTGPTGAPGCEDPANFIGSMGKTTADGYWFRNAVHSEYYPVLCGPDYVGYGQGFYQLEKGLLWLDAENGPFNYDDEGNATFCRKGRYNGDKSDGKFAGAFGWEIAISHTAPENNPANPANMGQGYSDVIIFGWVYVAN